MLKRGEEKLLRSCFAHIETIWTSAQLMICSTISPNLTELQAHVSANIRKQDKLHVSSGHQQVLKYSVNKVIVFM